MTNDHANHLRTSFVSPMKHDVVSEGPTRFVQRFVFSTCFEVS